MNLMQLSSYINDLHMTHQRINLHRKCVPLVELVCK